MSARFVSVDDYLGSLPKPTRAVMDELRRTIRAVVPDVGEKISYQMPTFTLDGTSLVHVAAWKNHIGLPLGGRGAERPPPSRRRRSSGPPARPHARPPTSSGSSTASDARRQRRASGGDSGGCSVGSLATGPGRQWVPSVPWAASRALRPPPAPRSTKAKPTATSAPAMGPRR